MLMFGFEVDTLEVQLREVVEVVDVIFIVEATVTHHGVRNSQTLSHHCSLPIQDKKPLMWERLQFDQRFLFLPENKVI